MSVTSLFLTITITILTNYEKALSVHLPADFSTFLFTTSEKLGSHILMTEPVGLAMWVHERIKLDTVWGRGGICSVPTHSHTSLYPAYTQRFLCQVAAANAHSLWWLMQVRMGSAWLLCKITCKAMLFIPILSCINLAQSKTMFVPITSEYSEVFPLIQSLISLDSFIITVLLASFLFQACISNHTLQILPYLGKIDLKSFLWCFG